MSQARKLLFAADEFYRSPVFVICIVAIYDNQLPAFERKWLKLRENIKTQLLRDAPRLTEHKNLSGDQLPEIHAVQMAQSESYYRLRSSDPGYKKDYWKRQYLWLEESLRILTHFNPKIFTFPVKADQQEIDERRKKSAEEYLLKFPGPGNKKRAEKFGHIAGHPYYFSLSAVISGIDFYLSHKGQSGEILFDDFDHSKGFYQGGILELLRQSGHLTSELTAQHASSLAHNLLQAADVVSYTRGRDAHARHFGSDASNGFFTRLDSKYIYPRDVSEGRSMFSPAIPTLAIRANLLNEICPPAGLVLSPDDVLRHASSLVAQIQAHKSEDSK